MDLATGRRELHRFRPGDSCDECNARRWYTDSSLRYCENGHRIESYVPFEHENENNYGDRGHVARRQKEVREREARRLSGVEARELFLECLQLLLRKQIAWLQQHEQQLRGESSQAPSSESAPNVASPVAALESVVRDLWDLRIRYFHGLTVTALAADDPRNRSSRGRSRSLSRSRSRSRSRATGGGATSGSESEARTLYSSQPETSDMEGGYTSTGSRISQMRRSSRTARNWQSGPDEKWNVPPIMETLALCYLGGVLLQLPYRIGDFYRWAKNGQIPFLEAIKHIPKVMRDRLSPSYHNALTMRQSSLTGVELHKAVLELVKGFMINNELQLPGLNVPPILWKWTRELGLPIDVYAGVLELSRISKEEYCYPVDRGRHNWIDHPDVSLLVNTILVTKLLYPFDDPGEKGVNSKDYEHGGLARYLTDEADNDNEGKGEDEDDDGNEDHGEDTDAATPAFVMDWKKWQEIYDSSSERAFATQHLDRKEIARLRSSDAWRLTGSQIDDYLDWHQELRLSEKEDPRHLLRLFPLNEIQPFESVADEPEEETDARYRQVQETCLVPTRLETEKHVSKKVQGKQRAKGRSARSNPLSVRHSRKYPLAHYRDESELPKSAHAFYSRAAKIAGIPVKTLVREVARLERRWKLWEMDKRSEARRAEQEISDDEEEATMAVDGEDSDGQDDFQRHAHLYSVMSSPPL